ncbi:hypothetical protein EV363DRAFT_1586459 [Boletus edulis]|nr:hypothetical protein EV363DRAFT_1586459 [Boletus edulis]
MIVSNFVDVPHAVRATCVALPSLARMFDCLAKACGIATLFLAHYPLDTLDDAMLSLTHSMIRFAWPQFAVHSGAYPHNIGSKFVPIRRIFGGKTAVIHSQPQQGLARWLCKHWELLSKGPRRRIYSSLENPTSTQQLHPTSAHPENNCGPPLYIEMYFTKTFIMLAAAAALVSATPSADSPKPDDNCNNTIGDCFSNNCNPSFPTPSDTIGTCTAGTYNGCPCEKCGGGSGFVGSCSSNGCNGFQGTCTAGQYQGCPCN